MIWYIHNLKITTIKLTPPSFHIITLCICARARSQDIYYLIPQQLSGTQYSIVRPLSRALCAFGGEWRAGPGGGHLSAAGNLRKLLRARWEIWRQACLAAWGRASKGVCDKLSRIVIPLKCSSEPLRLFPTATHHLPSSSSGPNTRGRQDGNWPLGQHWTHRWGAGLSLSLVGENYLRRALLAPSLAAVR